MPDDAAHCPLCGGEVAPDDLLVAMDRGVIVRHGQVARLAGNMLSVFRELYAARPRVVAYDRLIGAVYPNPADEPDDALKTLQVMVSNVLKRELRRVGLTITTVRGRGYALDCSDRAKTY